MTITFTLPLAGHKPTTSKDRILSILADKHPLSLIELQNAIEKQYGKRISFQSVRQAALELEDARVLVRADKKFAISPQWIQELIGFGSKLQNKYLTKQPKDALAVGPNVSVYTVRSMLEVDSIWNSVIEQVFNDDSAPREIAFSSVHLWFLLATLAQESALVKQQIAKGIRMQYVCYGSTPLDAWAVRTYQDLGVACVQAKKPADYSLGLHIGAYGNYVIQVQYPEHIAQQLDAFYSANTSVESAKLAEIFAITAQDGEFQLTTIHDAVLARTFRDTVARMF